mmetsp:Transcript_4137/g.10009  ORF Transcript_4137/g.10009 Transcript_4137/m.10009 type:complete len:139 (-) Transcript_4137:65-481(-)
MSTYVCNAILQRGRKKRGARNQVGKLFYLWEVFQERMQNLFRFKSTALKNLYVRLTVKYFFNDLVKIISVQLFNVFFFLSFRSVNLSRDIKKLPHLPVEILRDFLLTICFDPLNFNNTFSKGFPQTFQQLLSPTLHIV